MAMIKKFLFRIVSKNHLKNSSSIFSLGSIVFLSILFACSAEHKEEKKAEEPILVSVVSEKPVADSLPVKDTVLSQPDSVLATPVVDSVPKKSDTVLTKPDTVPKKTVAKSDTAVIAPDSSVKEILKSETPVDSAKVDSTIQDSSALADTTLCGAYSGSGLCDSRDGKIYGLVKIGSQVWMAENLNYKTPESYCYDELAENCKMYGCLYSWTAALQIPGQYAAEQAGALLDSVFQGVCPEGFHIPSAAEFEQLKTIIVSRCTAEHAGGCLKKQGAWQEESEIKAEWHSEFNALPAGYRGDKGDYNYLAEDVSFWIRAESGTKSAPYWNLNIENDLFVGDYTNKKTFAYSVRCIKD